MSLFGGIYVGASGIQSSQNALNTTAHNLSNLETKGYTRQQVELATKSYATLSKSIVEVANQEYGLGTKYANAKQVRDYFLDLTYRRESGRCSFYQVTTETYDEVESLLGELDGEAFQSSLSDLWTSIQELAKDPSSSVTQGMLIQRAEEFIDRAVSVYDGISFYQDNLNQQISQKIDRVNELGKQLLELNDTIRKVEADGIESANDLRDTRNSILDELSELADISYTEDQFGNVYVRLEGTDFVKGSTCYEIQLQENERNGFYTPFWPQNANYVELDNGTRKYNIEGAEVFKIYGIEVSSNMNNDIGSVKAALMARGDKRANYTDIADYDHISHSAIMNVQAEFDQLVHNVVTAVNDVLAKAAGVPTDEEGEFLRRDLTLQDGRTLQNVIYVEKEVGGYMRKENGSPVLMFEKIVSDSYEEVKGADGKSYFVFKEEDPNVSDSLITLRNISIDKELKQMPSLLGFIRKDGTVDQETADALKNTFSEEKYLLNPEIKKKSNFMNYYTDMVSQLANNGSVNRSIYENQQNTVESTSNSRNQVIGVSSDEELSNMIKFQNAFNASSRYINALSEMIEHLINALAT